MNEGINTIFDKSLWLSESRNVFTGFSITEKVIPTGTLWDNYTIVLSALCQIKICGGMYMYYNVWLH